MRRSTTAVWLARSAGAALVGFHAILLWERISTGTLMEPAILLKWIASFALCLTIPAALRYLRREDRVSARFGLTLLLALALIHTPVGTSDAGPTLDALATYAFFTVVALSAVALGAVDGSVDRRSPVRAETRIALSGPILETGAARAPPAIF